MIFNSLHSQAHHREIVVGFGAVAVGLHFGGEGVDDLAGALEVGVAQDAEQAVVAAEGVVHACTDFCRHHLLFGEGEEQACGLRHEK